MPRSGSTWLFNAARLLLARSGQSVRSAWVADYDPGAAPACAVHLVKLHWPEQLVFPSDLVLTTRRDIADCVASLVRMGWVGDDPAAIRAAALRQQIVYRHWQERSRLEVLYRDILGAPAGEVQRIAACLGVTITGSQAGELAARLAAMTPPDAGSFDPVTLLHPRHRSGAGPSRITAAEVADILASGGQNAT